MMTVVVVVIDESKDSLIKRHAVFLRLDVNIVIFYRSPKSFYPDVVLCPAPAVHTDLHFRMLGARSLPIQAGKLTPLIRVNDFRYSILRNGVFEPLFLLLGYLRNFLAEGDCAAGVVSIVIPRYVERCGFELDQYQVYARFVLIDTETGYRSQSQDYSTIIMAR